MGNAIGEERNSSRVRYWADVMVKRANRFGLEEDDAKTFWIPKIRKPFRSKRYENL